MTMPLKRLTLVVALAGVSFFSIGATQALAATDVDLQPSPFGSTLDMDDLTNDADAIVVSVAGGTITIVDTGTGGLVTADLECTTVSATTVTCPLDPADPAPPAQPTAPVRFVDIQMNDGTDSFTNQNLLADVEESDGGETGNKTVSSGPGDDEIATGVGNDVVNLGAGDDETETDDGNDIITGGPGEDDVAPEAGSDVANAGDGTDDIDDEGEFSDGPDVLDGGPGADDEIEYDGQVGATAGVTMTIDGVADDGYAGEGDNLTGFEDLNGTPGADRMVGSASNDELFPDAGDDTIAGGAGDDELGGGEGNDLVEGGEGADEIEGGNEPDGADAMNGGPGGDQLEYGGPQGVSITLNGLADDGRPAEGDNVANVEGLDGTEKADTLVGNASSNVIRGFGGNDTLTGGGGNDAIAGGDGDDLLLALGGRDDVRCGLGFDTPIHDAEDVVAGGCERRGAEVASDSAFANGKGKARVRVACPAEEGATCKGIVALLSNGKQIASGRFSVANGRRASATVRLTRQGRRALSKSGSGLRVTAVARTTEPQGVSSNATPLELDNAPKKKKKKKKR